MKNKELNILLVDDHTVVRKGMKLLIQSQFTDARIYDAKNAIDALELCKSVNFDVVITDITMPEMNGIELTKILTKNYPATKTIIISMHLDEMYIKDSIKAGAKGYLSKSMSDEREVLEAINAVLEGNTFYGKKTSQMLIKSMFNDKGKKLTPKEIEIARCLSDGLVYKEIADRMNISPRTVETYRKNILEKLGLETTADIIKYAIKNGLVVLD